MGTDRD
jgi:photosystem II stability/assembly factor-like uncharacterized protein